MAVFRVRLPCDHSCSDLARTETFTNLALRGGGMQCPLVCKMPRAQGCCCGPKASPDTGQHNDTLERNMVSSIDKETKTEL